MTDDRKFFADELEKLLVMPIETKAQLDAWHRASADLRGKLQSEHSGLLYEGETYHFLVDAEIRQRDSKYRLWQEGEIRSYIQRVRTAKDANE